MLYQLSYACTLKLDVPANVPPETGRPSRQSTGCFTHSTLPCVTTTLRAGDGARTRDIKLGRLALYQLSYSREEPPRYVAPLRIRGAWWGKDSNLRRLAPSDLQSDPFGHSGTPPHISRTTTHARSYPSSRADGENRTRNRLITNQVLCQLSYVSRRPFQRETRRIVSCGRGVKATHHHDLGSERRPPGSPRTRP